MALGDVIQPRLKSLGVGYSQDTKAHESRDADFAPPFHLKVPEDGNGEQSKAQVHKGGPCYPYIN